MFRPSSVLLAPLTLAVAALAACNDAPAKVAPSQVALSDFAITAPASIPASMATFSVTNSGKEAHQAGLARLDSGKTVADFVAAMKDDKGPPPAWITWLGGAQEAPGAPAGQFVLGLEPGNYVWYCVIPGADGVPHMMKGMVAAMTVTAASGAAVAPPTSDIDVTMHDYQWDLSTPITSGTHTLKITTTPGQTHELVLVKLAPGKTAQDALAWAATMNTAPPFVQLSGIAMLKAGQVNYETVDFTPGNYAFICFVPDASDGKPHALHGMVKEFAIQ